jgi:hypothetical protein
MRGGSGYIAARHTTIDRLPIERLGSGKQGSRAGISAADRQKLDDMRAELLKLLAGDGISRGWLVDRTGIPLNHVTQYLGELGAKRTSGQCYWRLPSYTRGRRP